MNSLPLDFAFGHQPLNRQSGARAASGGPDHPSSRIILLHGDRPILQGAKLLRFKPDSLPPAGPPILLGIEDGGRGLYAAAAKGEAPEGLADLRSLMVTGGIEAGELAILAQARALLFWHARHGFCAHCGQPTRQADAGAKRICDGCQAEHFPRTDPVVILTVTHGRHVLLARNLNFPPGLYSALAGFMEPGESIEDAARRELAEETGIVAGELRYVASQPWPFPSSLMIGLTGKALSTRLRIDPDEIADARWFTREEAEAMLRGDHGEGLYAPKSHAIAYHLLRVALTEM